MHFVQPVLHCPIQVILHKIAQGQAAEAGPAVVQSEPLQPGLISLGLHSNQHSAELLQSKLMPHGSTNQEKTMQLVTGQCAGQRQGWG